jgi:UDP-glucose 4-epimerase
MTKALQERLVLQGNLSRANKGSKFCCVRYGNVLRSRGSVVPFFRRQLALGQTITITDERMTRFLLTLNQAIDLVLYAAENTQGGEIFVRKAKAATIPDIGRVLSEEAGKPFDYKIIGIIPGEKLHEILVSEEELVRGRDFGDYYAIQPWWNKARYQEISGEFASNDYLADLDEVKRMIELADQEFEIMEMADGEFAKF